MRQTGSKLIRYTMITVLIFGGVFATLGTFLSIYDGLQVVVSWLPTLLTGSLRDQLMNPWFIGTGLVACILVGVWGKRRYGTLESFVVWVFKQFDSILGWSLFEEPLFIGRIKHQGIAWRFKYWEGGHVETVDRECLLCGLGLVERILPEQTVHGPNTAFNPGEANRETTDDVWSDVFGQEKAENRNEIQALSCPKCNFSVPGTIDILEGVDGAKAKFRQHADRIQTSGRLEEYTAHVRQETNKDPSPSAVWDAYVKTIDAEDALPVDLEQVDHSERSSTGQNYNQTKPPADQQGVASDHA